ncbi:hypothetical protein HZH68_012311 [Vespula germanica]|uniref:Uncharacterized protein n=1 Tax=Vespula germanica TaxID=30212 RepID=A0A834MYF8_VESGE|nr:hypothetical protein HZH68_012311 [Vespula germanica]
MQNVLRVRKLEELVALVVDSRVFRQEDEQEGEEKRKRKKDRLIREESQGLPYPKGKEGEGKVDGNTDNSMEWSEGRQKAYGVWEKRKESTSRSFDRPRILDKDHAEYARNGNMARRWPDLPDFPEFRSWKGKEIEGGGEKEKTKWSQFPDPSSIRKSGLSRVPTDRMQIIELALWTRSLSLAGRIDRKPVGNC